MALMSMKPTNEMASCFFFAKLRNLDPAIVGGHERWVEATRVERTLRNCEDGPVALSVSGAVADTSRQHRSLLRTFGSHWEMLLRK